MDEPGELLVEVARFITREAMPAGARLVELRIARALGVSRPPVRRALDQLARHDLVELAPRRGFVLKVPWDAPPICALTERAGSDEALYLRIAGDRLDGRLPDVVTEARLRDTYGLSKAQSARLLDRMSAEGWVDRRPGYGWRFLATAPTRDTYLQGYRFRILVEPAALLEPGFTIDAQTLDRLAADQRRMLDPSFRRLTLSAVFEAGCRFHEDLVARSGNPFFLDAVQRVNRMRRLIEYRALGEDAVRLQSAEHLQILDRLRDGDRQAAADMLRHHLEAAQRSKADALDRARGWPGGGDGA